MLELVPCVQMGDWDQLVAAHPRATVFHRSDWLALIARLARAQLHPFLIRRDAAVVGLFPVFIFRRGPFRIAASPPAQVATPYLGPLVDDSMLGDALEAFARAARRLKASYLELRCDREIPPAVLAQASLQHETRATFLLDVSAGPEVLWRSNLTSACRRAVRKAQAAGLVVEETPLSDVLDRYFELAAGVFAKWNRPPPLSRADYAAIGAAAIGGEYIKVFVARRKGTVVAAGIFPFANGTVYYLDGVSDPAGQDARPNNLLHWEVIRWASAAGLTRYDMVGAGIAGVARFKQSFGPAEVPYSYAFRSLSWLAGIARDAYARLAPAARAAQYTLSRRRPSTPDSSAED